MDKKMADYKQLRDMQATYQAAAEGKTQWTFDTIKRCNALAGQISILAGHLADLMLPVASPPPVDDEYVAAGCRLFSNPEMLKA